MKKNFCIFSLFLLAQFSFAKDYTLVVKAKGQITKGNTEVFVHEGEDSDTLTVTPGSDVTTITVTVRDLDGTLLQQDVLSAAGDYMNFSTCESGEGCILTVRSEHDAVKLFIE